jgi:hypothetical protein
VRIGTTKGYVSRWTGRGLAAAVVLVLGFVPAAAQWRIPSPGAEGSELKVGLLAKVRAEHRDTLASDDSVRDFYIRNLRFLAAGKLTERLSLFFETDAPNLGRTGADGSKGDADMFIQDFVLTYAVGEDTFVDGGMLLGDLSYNHSQSAASQIALDYGPYTFLENGPLDERVGRDYGVRLRGYAAGGALEYRAAVLSGRRGDDGTEPYRYTLRLQWYPLEPLRGLFYQGTAFGGKKVLALGASYDSQDDYETVSANLYGELPVGTGNAVTWLIEGIEFDGGEFAPELPQTRTTLAQLGFHFGAADLTPFVRYAEKDFDLDALADEERLQVGLSWFPAGHRWNLKAAVERLEVTGLPDRDRFSLQAQLLAF